MCSFLRYEIFALPRTVTGVESSPLKTDSLNMFDMNYYAALCVCVCVLIRCSQSRPIITHVNCGLL